MYIYVCIVCVVLLRYVVSQLGSHPTEQYILSTVHSLLEPRSIQRDFCCIRLDVEKNKWYTYVLVCLWDR